MSTAKDATDGYKMAQTPPTVVGTDVAAADAPACGRGGEERGPIDEGRRAGRPPPPPGEYQPPLGH